MYISEEERKILIAYRKKDTQTRKCVRVILDLETMHPEKQTKQILKFERKAVKNGQ